MGGDFAAEVFKVLKTELTREEFAALHRLTSGYRKNPFIFNRELGEFVTDDDWGLVFAEEALDTVADLVARCCDILTRHYHSVNHDTKAVPGQEPRGSRGEDGGEPCDEPGKVRYHSFAVSLESPDIAEAFTEALRRNGYQYTASKTPEGHRIEVGFSACSDYEHFRERNNIRLLLEVAGRKAAGTRFWGTKLT